MSEQTGYQQLQADITTMLHLQMSCSTIKVLLEQCHEAITELRNENDRLTAYCSELAKTVEERTVNLWSARKLSAQLNKAIGDGGFVVSTCGGCGKPVVCLDSGEGGLCSECAEWNR